MSDTGPLSKDELDYLREVMNIGLGNAVTALSQLLKSKVDLRIEAVYSLPPKKIPFVISDPAVPVVCVRMKMLGDVNGDMFFIVPEREKDALVRMAENAILGSVRKGTPDISVLEEIGNILAGVYLSSIHDFCKLNIYHSVPVTGTDMLQSLLDELLIDLTRQGESFVVSESEIAIMVETRVATSEKEITAFLLTVPTVESVKVIVESIKEAMPE